MRKPLFRRDVLDKGFVELLDMMPHPDTLEADEKIFQAITNAARTSYNGESKGEEKDLKLLKYLIEHHHDTPLEMIQFKFRIHAPVVVWWQLVRHRTMSFNLMSSRYTQIKEDEFYVPDVWRKQSEVNKQGSDGEVDYEDQAYLENKYMMHLQNSYDLYNEAIKRGVSKEMARLFLPFSAAYFTGIVSVNLRNLLHFIELRETEEAQEEIRRYATAMKTTVMYFVGGHFFNA